MTRKEKKNKDRFSVTIIGMVIYSAILVCVMGGSYIGVKAIIRNSEKSAQVEEAIEETEAEEIVDNEEEVIEEPSKEEEKANEEEVVLEEHKFNVSDVIDSETGYIEYIEGTFEPAKRDTTLQWTDTIFSKIESVRNPKDAAVNTFFYKTLNATLSDGKQVEYRAYTNPDNDYIEKITEVVNCGENYQVFDYYYDSGILNYVAQYNMAIEKPVPLSSSQIESRYYYKNDVMVRYIYCGDGKAIEYTVADINNYSDGTVEQYDYLEKDIINRAYIVYNLAGSLVETQTVYGYVMDEFSIPLEDAEVTIINDSTGNIEAKGQTDGDGFYKLSLKCDDKDTFTVKVEKETLSVVSVYGITSKAGSGRFAVSPVYLSYEANGGVYNVQILARDAVDTTKGLAGASIKLRRGINDTDGEVILVGNLDETGAAIVPMTAGCYTAEVSKGGYETTYFPVIVRIDHQAAIGFAVPDVFDNGLKVVLSWEVSPLDLDFKAITSGQAQVIKATPDSMGATTAETIIIDDPGTDTYRFYVSDYGSIVAGDAYAYNLTNSNATVTVYGAEGQLASYHVPVASSGVVWEALEIRNGEVLPMNNYYYSIEDSTLWKQK